MVSIYGPDRLPLNEWRPMYNEVRHQERTPLVILLNGASSSGKSTLCKALQERCSVLAGADQQSAFARVGFDDVVLPIPENRFPISYVRLQGRETNWLVSQEPHDGLAAWEYIDESGIDGHPFDEPRARVVMSPSTRRQLTGLHRGWGEHLRLGTNLIIDHFLQERDWCDELLGVFRDTGVRVLLVGVHCSVEELERREAFRADGGLEGRPRGLARRSNELCHAHGLDYDVNVWTDRESTAESVEALLVAMASADSIPW